MSMLTSISGLTVKGVNLQVYALSFFAIPLVRWLLIKRRNAAIEERNQARMNAAAGLERPALRRKLAGAAKLANRTVIDDRDLVYSSDRCSSLALVWFPGVEALSGAQPFLFAEPEERALLASAGLVELICAFGTFGASACCLCGCVSCPVETCDLINSPEEVAGVQGHGGAKEGCTGRAL